MIDPDRPSMVSRMARHLSRALRDPRYLISGRARRRMRYRDMLDIQGDAQARFSRIYEERVWRGGGKSQSGQGSTLESTRGVREQLPRIVRERGIDRLLDAPCGDFGWMIEVLRELPALEYVGGDIVPALIDENRRRFASDCIRFEHLDLTRGELPKADLILVRDCLFHLSYADITAFLRNLSQTQIRWLLTTTHISAETPIENRDIVSGDFRPIDLFAAPFGFPPPVDSFNDGEGYGLRKQLCLFDIPPLVEHLQAHSRLMRSENG